MKKNIIYSLIVVMITALITSCGTNVKENPESNGPYSFFNATTPLKISAPIDVNGTIVGGTYVVSVDLLGYGFPLSAEIINMRPFDIKYGFVTNSVVLTDINGRASFAYNLPENYSLIRGQDTVIQAVYLDNTVVPNPNGPTNRPVLLTQDFVLQFR